MRALAALGMSLLLAASALAQSVLPVPALSARVIDQTGTLDAAQRQALEQRLAAFERDSGAQIVILMVRSTRPEEVAAYAWRVADAWKIGRRDVGDGVLLVVAKDDRRVRIEVARRLEGAIPDLAASRIIDERITPAFRASDFAGGLQGAVDALTALIRGEALPAPPAPREPAPGPIDLHGFWFPLLFVVPFMAGVLRRVAGRRVGALLTGSGAAAVAWALGAGLLAIAAVGIVALVFALVSGFVPVGGRGGGIGPVGGWSGGGSSRGGGGGGFSSGGGGSFGGGGASGGW